MAIEEKIKLEETSGGTLTASEIAQQPRLWRETLNQFTERKAELQNFLQHKVHVQGARIVFTGAGTSAYVGDTVAPWLRRQLSNQVDSIATTDIVSNPLNYLKPDAPTVLVSYARSGNSPESLGTYHLSKKLIKNLTQVIITCNKDGQLAKEAEKDPDCLLLLMPEESNDKGFAMTSSFSCMYLATLLLFKLDDLEGYRKKVLLAAENAEQILKERQASVLELAELGKKKVVYLGSSALKGLAQETSLKNLELSAGRIPTFHESVLGFRHGPKSIVDDDTLIFMFISNDAYTRKYEIDFLKELKNDGGSKTIVAIANSPDVELLANCEWALIVPTHDGILLEDELLALNYVLYGQLFALFSSLRLGVTPDNPSPSGMVNRVVKGVTIHEFEYSGE
ncbi:SIS domain-containing protein [Bacillus sp. FJAT-27245]|uniref:SIS domain-containing protein n=1 Tax=Bacillus sp. FJAT-27245 TaxID=1684144 RepID=UPI0006A7CA08|nr:SIS domain-containing protein [Bacillus sp. FJAT-27245]